MKEPTRVTVILHPNFETNAPTGTLTIAAIMYGKLKIIPASSIVNPNFACKRLEPTTKEFTIAMYVQKHDKQVNQNGNSIVFKSENLNYSFRSSAYLKVVVFL